MKKFISKIAVFLFPLMLVIIVLFITGRNLHHFQPSNMYYYQEFEAAFSENSNFDVVLIGNSKLLSAIDKKKMEENNKHSVANLGYSSSNISVSKLTLESYLNNCSNNPKLVLLEVSWFTFSDKRTKLHDIVGDLFMRDFKLWKNYFRYNTALLPIIKKSWIVSLKNNIRGKHSIKQTSYAVRFKESTPYSIDYRFDPKEMEAIFPDHIAGINESLLNDFYSIVHICKTRNIDLILFTAPEDENYSKLQKDILEVKKVFHDVASANQSVFYLDYSLGGNLYNKKFEKWLANSHHINENNLFSTELLDDIKACTHNSIYKK